MYSQVNIHWDSLERLQGRRDRNVILLLLFFYPLWKQHNQKEKDKHEIKIKDDEQKERKKRHDERDVCLYRSCRATVLSFLWKSEIIFCRRSKQNSENKQTNHTRWRRQIRPPGSTYSSKCTRLFSSQSVKQKPLLPLRRPLKWTINGDVRPPPFSPFFFLLLFSKTIGSQSVDYNTKIWGETSISFFTHIQMKEEPLHHSYNHIFIDFYFFK